MGALIAIGIILAAFIFASADTWRHRILLLLGLVIVNFGIPAAFLGLIAWSPLLGMLVVYLFFGWMAWNSPAAGGPGESGKGVDSGL